MPRLYSFRYPVDIRAALEPWKDQLGREFNQVVSMMTDRDRALEDHLNLGVAQGRLAYTITTSNQTILDNTTADITTLSVTVSLPANRVIRVSGQAIFNIISPMDLQGWVNQDGLDVGMFGDLSDSTAGGSTVTGVICAGSVILTPTAGSHTYKLRATAVGSGTAVVGATTAAPGFILVEDIGPVT